MEALLFAWILGAAAPGVGMLEASENMDKYLTTIAHIESDMNRYAVVKGTTASSYFQITVNAFETAKNRAARMGWKINAKYVGELSYKQQKTLVLVDLYQRKGTDAFIKLIAQGNAGAGKMAFYRWHHTNPDAATRYRVNKMFRERY